MVEPGADGPAVPVEDLAGIRAGQKCRALVGEDVEIAKLIAYRQILACRAAGGGTETKVRAARCRPTGSGSGSSCTSWQRAASNAPWFVENRRTLTHRIGCEHHQ